MYRKFPRGLLYYSPSLTLNPSTFYYPYSLYNYPGTPAENLYRSTEMAEPESAFRTQKSAEQPYPIANQVVQVDIKEDKFI